MASLLSARRKKQKWRRPPRGEDEVDFYTIPEDSTAPTDSQHHRPHHYPTDERAPIHGRADSEPHEDAPSGSQPSPYEGESLSVEERYGQHPEGEPKRHGLFKKKDTVGSSSAHDLELVEMRHPGRPRYVTSPSSDSEGGVIERAVSRRVRASAYSTLSLKSWSEVNSEISVVTRDLNKHFKPMFEKHGSEGVSIEMLTEELNSRRSQHLLGRDSILQKLRAADKDGDDYLSYADFVIMITQDLKNERTLAFRGMLLSTLATIGVLPKELRDNFLANYRICPPPLFIPIMSLIQVIFFAVYVADMENKGLEVTANSGYPSYSPFHYKPSRRYEAYRFLTYMFIHDGYMHIIFNMVAQLFFGFPLEMVHGWWRVAIIYLCGVTAGSLAHSVVDPWVGLVGASGGGYAILGAHLAAVVTNWKEMNYMLCDQEEFDSRPCCAISRIFFSAPFRMVLIVFIMIPDTGLAIVRRVAFDENLQVGISAHVGGFLTGLFLGIPVLKNINKHAWETNLGWVTLVIFLLLCAFAIFFNSFFDERYPPTDWD